MLLINFIVLTSFGCLARGYVVPSKPSSVAPGFEPSLLALKTADITNVLNNRDAGVVHCACGFNTDSGNTQAAVQDMQIQIGTTSRTIDGPSMSVVVGDVIAFMCQHNTALKLSIDGAAYSGYISQIKSACGENVAGTYSVYDQESGDTRHFGYMRYSVGVEIHVCDSPDSAPATSCTPNERSENRALSSLTYNSSSVLDSREDPVQNFHCLCGTTVEENSYNDAKAAMTADLNTGKWSTDGAGNFRHLVVRGDTVAFFCILGTPEIANQLIQYGGPSSKADFNIDARHISEKCGDNVPGSLAKYSDSFTNHYGFFQTSNPNPDPVALCTSPDLFVSANHC